jgi:hypothetical protein
MSEKSIDPGQLTPQETLYITIYRDPLKWFDAMPPEIQEMLVGFMEQDDVAGFSEFLRIYFKLIFGDEERPKPRCSRRVW